MDAPAREEGSTALDVVINSTGPDDDAPPDEDPRDGATCNPQPMKVGYGESVPIRLKELDDDWSLFWSDKSLVDELSFKLVCEA
jgi:hypothetical protein